LEDLRIRRHKRLGRRFNRRLGGWAFAQLEAFLAYKLEEVGKCVVKVSPAYTSRLCSRCGNRGVRAGSNYRCPVCGLRLHADLNAARNIARLGMTLVGRPLVNGPIVAGGETEVKSSVEPSYKPPISMGGS
jgi:transposase